MKSKIIFITLIFALALALIGEYLFFTNKLFDSKNGLNVEVRSKKEQSVLYNVDVEYPLFDETPKLSADIENFVNTSLDNFKKESSLNWQARKDNASPDENLGEYPEQAFTFFMSWQPQQLNDQYLSFVLKTEEFNGGAHPDSQITTYNYDLKQKTEVKLADLFPGQKDYLGLISNYARTTLETKLDINQSQNPNLKDMFIEGTAPKEENFSNFTFDDQVITFYFPVYQLGPRDLGAPSLVYYRDNAQFDSNQVNMSNPASDNCIDKGGNLEIKQDADGNEFGVCVFADNRQCEEWALYRNECFEGGVKITGYDNQGQIDCAIRGGELDIKNKMCTLPNKIDCAMNENGIVCPDIASSNY